MTAKLVSEGVHHDLQLYLDRSCFTKPIAIAAKVCRGVFWKSRYSRKPTYSIALAHYLLRTNIITVSPRLDHNWVPGYFLQQLIFHELLHRVVPKINGDWHSSVFTELEKSLPYYREADNWWAVHRLRVCNTPIERP